MRDCFNGPHYVVSNKTFNNNFMEQQSNAAVQVAAGTARTAPFKQTTNKQSNCSSEIGRLQTKPSFQDNKNQTMLSERTKNTQTTRRQVHRCILGVGNSARKVKYILACLSLPGERLFFPCPVCCSTVQECSECIGISPATQQKRHSPQCHSVTDFA